VAEGHVFFFIEITSYFKCPNGGVSVVRFFLFVGHNQNAAAKCDTDIALQKQITPWKTLSCLVDDTRGHTHSKALWALMSRRLDFLLPL